MRVYLVPAFLTVLLATTPAAVRASFAQAAASAATQAAPEECLSKPGATAPQGSHWYYRINRADRRHCWYLGSDTARTRAREATTRASSAKSFRQRSAGRASGDIS